MSKRYEEEQVVNGQKIKALNADLQKAGSQTMTMDMFVGAVRKYTRVRKLTPRLLNELVEKIEVYHAEKIEGIQTQRIVIHYNCIGSIEIPQETKIPFPEITMPTRVGVSVTYVPNTVTISA